MKILRELTSFDLQACRLIIGKFDGIHLGHKQLIDSMCIGDESLPLVMLTFDFSYLSGWEAMNENRLFTYRERVHLAKCFGVDYLLVLPFTEEFRSMSSEEFVCNVLLRQCHAKAICVGENFRFGKDRRGDVSLLHTFCERNGIELQVIPMLCYEQDKISSTKIRSMLLNGDMQCVKALLGYPYFMLGDVEHGKRIGHQLGFPTLNLSVSEDKQLPPSGVYSTVTLLRGQFYQSITNIGDNPTVKDDMPHDITVESHVLDFDDDVYGETCMVFFLEKMRDQSTFSSLDALKEQLSYDKSRRREMDSDLGVMNGLVLS